MGRHRSVMTSVYNDYDQEIVLLVIESEQETVAGTYTSIGSARGRKTTWIKDNPRERGAWTIYFLDRERIGFMSDVQLKWLESGVFPENSDHEVVKPDIS